MVRFDLFKLRSCGIIFCYSSVKAFNAALETLLEATSEQQIYSWSKLHLKILERSCDCYWNLNMPREYLRKLFDVVQIPGYEIFLDEVQTERISKAVHILDDVLSLDFEKFFKIDEIEIKHLKEDSVFMQINLNSPIILVCISLLICF